MQAARSGSFCSTRKRPGITMRRSWRSPMLAACSGISSITRRSPKPHSRIDQLRNLDLIGAEIALTAEAMNREIRAAERRIVIAGLAGNVMEWYDFGTYGFFAAIIGNQFFPAHNPTVSLLASFAVFAIGFIGRPMGALIFGHIGDRSGRKRALMASVIMMALPTMLIGSPADRRTDRNFRRRCCSCCCG